MAAWVKLLRARWINSLRASTLFSVILNGLRHRNDSRSLRQNSYHRAVLSPKNFDRFSDGILQGCILRAARAQELAYGTCGEAESAAMLQLLLDSLVNGLDDPKAEGVNEFLISIGIGNLALLDSDLAQFAGAVLDRSDEVRHAATRFLAKGIRSRKEWL